MGAHYTWQNMVIVSFKDRELLSPCGPSLPGPTKFRRAGPLLLSRAPPAIRQLFHLAVVTPDLQVVQGLSLLSASGPLHSLLLELKHPPVGSFTADFSCPRPAGCPSRVTCSMQTRSSVLGKQAGCQITSNCRPSRQLGSLSTRAVPEALTPKLTFLQHNPAQDGGVSGCRTGPVQLCKPALRKTVSIQSRISMACPSPSVPRGLGCMSLGHLIFQRESRNSAEINKSFTSSLWVQQRSCL